MEVVRCLRFLPTTMASSIVGGAGSGAFVSHHLPMWLPERTFLDGHVRLYQYPAVQLSGEIDYQYRHV